jgi:hypothetical protein
MRVENIDPLLFVLNNKYKSPIDKIIIIYFINLVLILYRLTINRSRLEFMTIPVILAFSYAAMKDPLVEL